MSQIERVTLDTIDIKVGTAIEIRTADEINRVGRPIGSIIVNDDQQTKF